MRMIVHTRLSLSPAVRRLLLLAACLGSAACWVLIRVPTARAIYGWAARTCVQVEMRASDPPCRLGYGRTVAVYLSASALVSLAVLIPSIVLAVRGRRVLAFVPMVAPAAVVLLDAVATWVWSGVWVPTARTAVSPVFLGPWASWTAMTPVASPWRPDHPLAITTDLVILAIPLIVYVFLFRPARAVRWTFGWRSALLASAIAIGASVAIEWGGNVLTGGSLHIEGGWFLQGLVVVSFGLLLPLGERRPFWAIPPVAILASLGPATMIVATLYRYTAFSWFRTALPLALMGFAAALAVALVARSRGHEREPRRRGRIRPVTVGYGLGVGALAVTLVMSALDPLPVALATPLPTYLGARDRVFDLRSRLTLDRARRSAEAFHEREGTFRGFDAETAKALDPVLLWDDGVPAVDTTFGPEIVVRIVTAAHDRIDLVVVSSATTYCLQLGSDHSPTYGTAVVGPPRVRVRSALDACRAQSWTSDLLQPFPVEGFCDDAPEITLCRGVQRLFRGVLSSPTGEPTI